MSERPDFGSKKPYLRYERSDSSDLGSERPESGFERP